jgi:hypothetical protein
MQSKNMNTVKLTPENAAQYIGYEIIFRSREHEVVRRILGVSETGKSVRIDHPDLKNHLQIVTRNVYVILDTKKDSDSVSDSD